MRVVEVRDDGELGDYEGQDDRIGLVMGRKDVEEDIVLG